MTDLSHATNKNLQKWSDEFRQSLVENGPTNLGAALGDIRNTLEIMAEQIRRLQKGKP